MLQVFRVKNYMSFKDDCILDLRATTYKQHMAHCINSENQEKLLKTLAIYGSNASGKSNLISAIYFFKRYVLEQFISSVVRHSDVFEMPFGHKFEKFLLDDEQNSTEFDIIFNHKGKEFQYGFEYDSKIISEWYYIDGKRVFERNNDQIEFDKSYYKLLNPYKKVPEDRLYIAVLDYFLDNEKNDYLFISDFTDYLLAHLNIYNEFFLETSIKNRAGFISLSDRLVEDPKYMKKVEEYIKRIDVGIEGIKVESKIVKDDFTGKDILEKELKTIHYVYNENDEVIGKREFKLDQESSGTIRFLSYIQEIIEQIENGGVFIVDELSARLHPLLTKLIIDLFQSSSNHKAQLIFSTHDVSILNNQQFRRDEIVLVEKNRRGESRIKALSDLKVREDASFSKDYLQGKYGAIPVFDYINLLGEF